MKKISGSWLLLLFLFLVPHLLSGRLAGNELPSGPDSLPSPDPAYRMIRGESFLQSKNVYLLTLFTELPGVRAALSADTALSFLAVRKKASLRKNAETCGDDPLCYSEGIRFSDAEIDLVSGRLRELAEKYPAVNRLVTAHLAPSGCYQLQYDERAGHYLAAAWEQDARAVNHAIDVYARGGKPNYPNIDSMDMKLHSRNFLGNVQALGHVAAGELDTPGADSLLFFGPSLSYALRAIEMNGMERAGDYEPMERTVNRPAVIRAGTVDWEAYPYPLILIPGAGPDNYLESLSPGGVLRCRLGAAAYRQGLAPFILVSGGNVHPYKTPYNEAIEMKKYLLKLGIPEEAILVDPHARHTTTNLRNAARIMFRCGVPVDRPSVTVTTPAQSAYIENPAMQERCRRELGYSPYRNGKRISPTTLEFQPRLEALQIDADEPMDP